MNFAVGQRVRVVNNSRGRYKNLDLLNREGEIMGTAYDPRSERGRLYNIKFDATINRYSVTGNFWFPAKDLEPVIIEANNLNTEEEKTMLPGYQTAAVQFVDGANREKTYFYALYDPAIAPGDMVVVSTGHHGLALARVAYIGGPASYVTCNREIVCRVDLSAWDERQQKANTLRQLREEMDERVKQYQATALYEMAAEKDPALKELLDKFKALQGA